MTFPNAEVTGYVLAGGASSRMGRDKALLRMGGRSWVEHAAAALRQVCADVAVLSGSASSPDRLQLLQRAGRIVPDAVAAAGPAAGVAAALADAHTPWVLLLAVDQPFLQVSLLCGWVETVVAGNAAASCMRLGRDMQPVPMLLRRDLSAAVASRVAQGERKLLSVVSSALTDLGSAPLLAFDVQESAHTEAWFRNLNTPEDLHRARAELEASNQNAAAASKQAHG